MSTKYSILLPTYNERKNIAIIIAMTMQIAEKENLEIEIVVVDDNSPDKTAEVVRAMQGIYGESKIILHSRGGKLGLGSAYIDGLEFCSGNFIFLMDADMSHHPKFIPEFIKKQKEMDADIITGTRYNSKGGVFGWNLWRKMTSRVANHIATVLLNPQVSDLTGSFRLYKREALSRVMKSVKSKGYVFQMEAIIRAQYMGYNIHQVPITFCDRIYGESKMGAMEIVNYLKGLWGIFLDLQ